MKILHRPGSLLKIMILVVFLSAAAACASPAAITQPSETVAALATEGFPPTPTAMPSPSPQPSETSTLTIEPTPPATPSPAQTRSPAVFDGERAYQDVVYQESLGPRTPGSEAHAQVVEWIQGNLRDSGWQVELQETTYREQPVRNVIARRSDAPTGSGTGWIIIGAHYDSRLWADRETDIDNQKTPVPGANDGASGVAVLLELARALPADLQKNVWLVFFDAEDQGRIPGWDWILGSRAFAESLETHPEAVVVVDMIGDADLNIYYERSSDQALSQQIWQVAASRGYGEQFIPQGNYSILDDHTPFLELGIPAVDIIDFDYPYWHTLEDTADKVSPDSLLAVGDTVYHWLAGLP